MDDDSIDAETAALVEEVYLYGLSEFAYRNGLNLHGRFQLPVQATGAMAPAPQLGLREHALVAIGGGKDSLVSIEALRVAGMQQTVVWIGASQLIRACAERSELQMLNVGRTLAPELFCVKPQRCLERTCPGDRHQLGNLGISCLTTWCRSGLYFSNERSARLWQCYPRHRRSEPSMVQELGIRAAFQ